MARHRSPAALFASWFDSAAEPVYVLSPERVVLYCNPACEVRLGAAATQVVGQVVRSQAPGERVGAAAAACVLYPPPSAWTEPDRAGSLVWGKPGEPLRRCRTRFLHLHPENVSGPLLVVIVDRHDTPPAEPDFPSHAPTPEADRLYERLRTLLGSAGGRWLPLRSQGSGDLARRLRSQLQTAGGTRLPTCVRGPRGSGAGEVARAIHYLEDRSRQGSLVPLDCGRLTSERLTGVLAEILAGAFVRGGRIPTVLLEDLARLPAAAIPGIAELCLRGADVCRLIAVLPPTGLPDALKAVPGPALLETLTVDIPPLAAQRSDLPLLAQAVLEDLPAIPGKSTVGFSPEALDALAFHPWTGEWDEFTETIRLAQSRASGPLILPADLPPAIRHAQSAALHPARPPEPIDLEAVLAHVETSLLRHALSAARGNKSKAAALLGLTRPKLYRRLVQLGLETPGGDVAFEEIEDASPGEPTAE